MPTFLHPTASKAQITQRCGRGYSKETGVSLASIRLRCTVMAAIWKTRHNNTMTSRLYGRRAIFVSGDVRFQDGDAVNLSKVGGGRFLLFSTSFFQSFTCASLFHDKVHI